MRLWPPLPSKQIQMVWFIFSEIILARSNSGLISRSLYIFYIVEIENFRDLTIEISRAEKKSKKISRPAPKY